MEFVPTEELLARTWPGVVVTDNVVHQVVARLRRLLDGGTPDPPCIETRRRRGYRLTLPVSEASPPGPTCRVFVHQFRHEGGRSKVLAEGLTDSIVSRMGAYRDVLVVLRDRNCLERPEANVMATFPGGEFHVNGSVRAAGDNVRVVVQLVDAHSEEVVWARSFDGSSRVEGGFDLEDRIAGVVCTSVADTFGAVRTRNMTQLHVAQDPAPTPYAAVLLAQDAIRKGWPSHLVESAIRSLERATERQPGYADAWSWLAAMYRDRLTVTYPLRRHPGSVQLIRREVKRNWEKAETAARQALSLDPCNQEALIVLFGAQQFRGDMRRFKRLADRALALNPSSADLHLALACYLSIEGMDEAHAHARQALALAHPEAPALIYYPLFVHHFRRGQDALALEAAERGLTNATGSWLEWALLLGAVAASGKLAAADTASRGIEELRERDLWSPHHCRAFFEMIPYRPEIKRRWRTGLSLAGKLTSFAHHRNGSVFL